MESQLNSASTSALTGRGPKRVLIPFDSALDLLISVMRDPLTTPVCANRMQVAARSIEAEFSMTCPTKTGRSKLAKSLSTFLRTGIKFLTHKYCPVEEHGSMVQHLGMCRCDMSEPGMSDLHDWDPFPPHLSAISGSLFLSTAVVEVAQILRRALTGTTKHKFRRGDTDKNGDLAWPQSEHDLLPNGLPDSIDGLDHWADWLGLEGSYIFSLASAIGEFYQPFAEALIRPPDHSFAIDRSLEVLGRLIDFYEGDPESRGIDKDRFEQPVTQIFEFLQLFVLQDRASPFHAVLVGKIGDITPVFNRLRPILERLSRDKWGDILIGIDMIIAIGNKDYTYGLHPRIRAGVSAQDPLKNALLEIIATRKGGCLNIACPQKQEILYSHLCSGCDLVRYCGKQCQKDAWKSNVFPHKELCPRIATLKKRIGKQSWATLFSDEVEVEQYLALPSKSRSIDTTLICEIGKEISKLKAFKSLSRAAWGLSDQDLEMLTGMEGVLKF